MGPQSSDVERKMAIKSTQVFLDEVQFLYQTKSFAYVSQVCEQDALGVSLSHTIVNNHIFHLTKISFSLSIVLAKESGPMSS